ncbi:MAG: hypothetical protein WC623_24510 [Pedobacter sp.]|uniref:hypothetical protein n=1 Tax=Pedobacter sp. TaxID=1411316 RepID=UPI0035667F6A
MNIDRRKRLVKISDAIAELSSDIEGIMEEEQEYYDNMPESFQNGEKGDLAQTAIDALQSAQDNCDEIIGSIEEATA